MFQQIKYYLHKTGLMRKEKLILLACLLFGGLFLTVKAADAALFDWPDMALNALDFVDNTVLHWLLYLFWLAAGSGTLLLISSRLLDWSSALPVHLDNVLVNFGWHYVAGLVNMFFILILIVIAFSYILKIESFGMKKALPRLLILAVLVNFSLLFVKIFSDAGKIY